MPVFTVKNRYIGKKIFQDVQDILIARAVARLHQIVTPTLAVRTCTPKYLARLTVHFKNSECFWGEGGISLVNHFR